MLRNFIRDRFSFQQQQEINSILLKYDLTPLIESYIEEKIENRIEEEIEYAESNLRDEIDEIETEKQEIEEELEELENKYEKLERRFSIYRRLTRKKLKK